MKTFSEILIEYGFIKNSVFGGYGSEEEVFILRSNRWAINEIFLHFYPNHRSFALRKNRSKGLAGVKQENKLRVDPDTGKDRVIEDSEWDMTFIPKPIRSEEDLISFLEGVL